MTVFHKAVTGFNHNIRHKGKAYHVQTEDSGVSNPHIITHLFVGGTIIASKKTSYADILGAENLTEIVRELMEEQHKAMLRNLLAGMFDEASTEAQERSYRPGEVQVNAPAPPLQTGTPRAPTPPPTTPSSATTAAPAPLAPAAAAWAANPGAKPAPQQPPAPAKPKSLFGEDLLSEKSLDEVILAYLADEDA